MADDSPSIAIRAVWFVAIGWWATGILLTAAWLFSLTVVGLPVGVKLVNVVPKALTLKQTDDDVDRVEIGGSSSNSSSILVRGIYFVLVGWWASLLWTGAAYLLCLSVVGLPFGIKMFNRLPRVLSLYEG
ncbi:YccF domain-containing protein [Halosimplex litoreum]|uniref:YccF domain-containing protein n=1 Tax=Halosimplex litoreum TaxID=1198301 RepID=A0A7T3FXJ6_9EURY|nr:YccF domain-containing protein [Halosimplex litoreum]QPV62138.1 YccF domain-containing protein [Halosimplex litoreum]